MAMSAEHRSNKSPYEWKILDWNDKPQTFIDRNMHYIMQNFDINAQVCTLYTLADLNIGQFYAI